MKVGSWSSILPNGEAWKRVELGLTRSSERVRGNVQTPRPEYAAGQQVFAQAKLP